MASTDPKTVLWEAKFNPKVRTYWLLSGAFVLAVTVVGLPLVLIWFAIGFKITQHYLDRMRCVLTERTLEFGKGVFIRIEKTIPLDKITDLGLVQGPLMRQFDLHALSVETAGQSSQGALVKLIGIENTEAFREAVLAQRDRMMETKRDSPGSTESAESKDGAPALLADIRDTLHRIERSLQQE